MKILILNIILIIIYDYHHVNADKPHHCARKCVLNEHPKLCRYKFRVDYYYTLSNSCNSCPLNLTDCYQKYCVAADGVKRTITVVNRQLPGPSIEVCKGDKIVVDVINEMETDTTAIHWHGIKQVNTPYMDGVPHITQCPIPPLTTFRYIFNVPLSGTYFWHSHSGIQRGDGISGALIVREPDETNSQRKLYDYDLFSHIINIQDWIHVLEVVKLTHQRWSDGGMYPKSLLINGRGRYREFLGQTNESIYTPTARFVVQEGFRYRMRLINSGFYNCPLKFSIDNHTITIIASDGRDIEPVVADSLVTYAGERFDFVVNANQNSGLYWIRVIGLYHCDESYNGAHQVAVLQYSSESNTGYPDGTTSYSDGQKTGGIEVNPFDEGPENNNSVAISELNSIDEQDDVLKATPDFVYFLPFDFYYIESLRDIGRDPVIPQFYNITFEYLPLTLLSDRYLINDRMFCNETTVENCSKDDLCECTYVVQMPLNDVVELILIDEGVYFNVNHPFHLHGHSFSVVAMEKLGSTAPLDEVKQLYYADKIKKNLKNPPIKDTVVVPDGGFTILRFKASNPGYWLFHCHLDLHMKLGMNVVFKVGKNSEMPPVPAHFPRCLNYLPKY